MAGRIAGIVLKAVDFNNSVIINRDSGDGAYAGPEWQDGNLDGAINPGPTTPFSNGTIDFDAGTPLDGDDDERCYPVAYERSVPGTPRAIGANVAMNFGGVAGIDWKVRATGGGFTFAAVTLAGGGGGLTGALVSTEALPETIDSRKLKITWQVSLDEGATWFAVGETENHLYVIGAQPPAAGNTEAFETVLHLGCEGAKGTRPGNPGESPTVAKARNRDVIDMVASGFSSRTVYRVDGTLLYYSHAYEQDAAGNIIFDPATGRPVPRFAFDVEGLMSRADGYGQCTAWTALFLASNSIHGVTGRTVDIITPAPVPGMPYYAIKVKPLLAQGTGTSLYGTDEFGFHAVVVMDDYDQSIHDPSYECIRFDAVPGVGNARIVYEAACFVGWVYTVDGRDLIDPDDAATENCIWR